jgi:AcrR family transcriptional regulator
MARKKQVADSKRRVPQQARARDTVEVIFEATARILLREGAGALNTNYIAERAGISVGTLYGYFPNKVAILLAMARREITRVTAAVVRAISSADPARLAIRALITEFSRHRKARRISFQTLVAEGFRAELEANMDEIAGALGGANRTRHSRPARADLGSERIRLNTGRERRTGLSGKRAVPAHGDCRV